MKLFSRILALLLCAVLLLNLSACRTEPPATEPTTASSGPTEPSPTEPAALKLYAEARAAIDEAPALSWTVTLKKTTAVGGETFSETSSQTLRCAGLDTDVPTFSGVETVSYGTGESVEFEEICTDGTLYQRIGEAYRFRADFTGEDYRQRLIPAVLLDASLYETVSTESGGTYTTVSFSQPVAGESWALPETAELNEASGTAWITTDGLLYKTAYSASYTYGSAEITLEAEVTPTVGDQQIQAPEDAQDFLPLDAIDAVRLMERAIGFLQQASAVSSSCQSCIFSFAAGVLRSDSVDIHMYADDRMAEMDTGIVFMDYSSDEEESYRQEETFRDNRYTFSADGSEPQAQAGVTWKMFRDYCESSFLSAVIIPDFWENAVITDLGSTYLVEFVFTEAMAESLRWNICSILFDDPELLDNLATDYVTSEVSGYFALDKYTGLFTSTGYLYAGSHTIDGVPYPLSIQTDISIEAPALGAYHAITGEMPEEPEPETKATPLFYHVTGSDGQEMWMLGTIHVGDERTAYLPQEIYDAFDASDALAVEFDTHAFEKRMEEDEDYQDRISEYYVYSIGSVISDHIDPDLYETSLKLLKAAGGYNINSDYIKPCFWSSTIENFFLRQGYRLTSDQGVDDRLLTLAEAADKPILDVESGEAQVAMFSGFSDPLQEMLLSGSVSADPTEYWEETLQLYEQWCQGDEAVLRESVADDLSELTDEERGLYEEYNNAMLRDRNRAMLKTAIGYLESGETVFFAVGLAHLLECEGLVDALRDAGYTVELVSFAG